MATFTRAHNVTTCDTCHEVTRDDWRSLAEHTAAHQRADQLAARQARIDLLNQERRAS